ncbi:hypothetical protein PSTT_14854 [Puccinia striiformis]|uniref:Rho-GAP domain-containing protein n=1 Tax=Puccinia striiformis TaxID=27350 RepID=A0A2S4UKX8_9BASI|nr:hypothetical protein PSTT_14854 [Puccinia striiformis]
MLKFRFPTKRNTHEHQPISPSSSATPNSSYQLNQASTDSIDQQQPQTDDENSLPINLPPPATTTSNTQQQQQQPVLSRKIRRKSYGGLSSLSNLLTTNNNNNNTQSPSSPITTNNINNNNDRPSSSSLRPFPFLAGIRRKSANATHFKNDSPHLNQSAGSNHSSLPLTPPPVTRHLSYPLIIIRNLNILETPVLITLLLQLLGYMPNENVYGVPIEDLYWRDGDTFPLLVDVLVELIEQKGTRDSYKKLWIFQGVRGVDIWRDSYRDVHNLSGLLKLFLREIPGGVIPFDRYDRFLAVNATPDEAERTSQLQSHVRDLPLPKFKILLLKLVKHFERHVVVEHAAANSDSVCTKSIQKWIRTFQPIISMQNIGKASAIVRHLVLNASQIFEESTSELLKQAAIETIREKKQQQHKRRSINMNLIDQQHQYQAKPQFSKSIKDDPLSLDSSSRRGSISSVITTTTNDELKKSRRGSVTIGKQKKSNNNTAQAGGSSTTTTTTSKRNPTRTNSGLCGKANKSNRHSLTNSILNSSSKPTPPTNLNLNLSSSSDSSSTHDSLLSPPLSNSKSSTSSSSSSSSSSTTPHPTLGFRHLTAKKKH